MLLIALIFRYTNLKLFVPDARVEREERKEGDGTCISVEELFTAFEEKCDGKVFDAIMEQIKLNRGGGGGDE